ncbi:MAG: PIN domain-containing protein [Chloroflexota bacterium]|nr:PIN domain-containing protein [Chloroflexota bacterium]MDE2886547.1 PIN domain-containing protein [Chloroflexota bacterium]
MTALLDINVLIALAWPNHVHHEAVLSWFREQRDAGWATCTLTEAGFVRVSCNPSAVRHAVTPADAIALLGELRRRGKHEFWPLDRSLVELPEAVTARLQGYRQVTDAVLVAAAMQHGGQLATLDTGLAQLISPNERRALCLIAV